MAGVGIAMDAIAGVGMTIAGFGPIIAGVDTIIAGVGDGLLHRRFALGASKIPPALFRDFISVGRAISGVGMAVAGVGITIAGVGMTVAGVGGAMVGVGIAIAGVCEAKLGIGISLAGVGVAIVWWKCSCWFLGLVALASLLMRGSFCPGPAIFASVTPGITAK